MTVRQNPAIPIALCTLLLCLCTGTSLFAADFYWTGAISTDWNVAGNWADSPGGNARATIPSSADNVLFDGASVDCVVNLPTVQCDNLDATGAAGITISSSSAGNVFEIYGNVKFVSSGFNWDYDGLVEFNAPDNATIESATQVFKNTVYFDEPGLGHEWKLLDPFECDQFIILEQGVLNTNSVSVVARGFHSNTSFDRKLILGSSLVTLTGEASVSTVYPWQIAPATGFTLDAGTSTIEMTAEVVIMAASGQTYNDVNFTDPEGNAIVFGNNTFNDLHFLGHGDIRGSNSFSILELSPAHMYIFADGATQTITTNLVAIGSCSDGFISLESRTKGVETTISAGIGISPITIDYCILQDIYTTGGATFDATNSINRGNNLTWGFPSSPTPKTYFWVGVNTPTDHNLWSNPANWSQSSGGAPDACIPSPCDKVVFDGSSFSAGKNTVTVDLPYATCQDMDWMGASDNPIFETNHTKNRLAIRGDLTFKSAMNVTYNGLTYFLENCAGLTNTLIFDTQILRNNVLFDGFGGSWKLGDNMQVEGTNGQYFMSPVNGGIVYLNYGSLDLDANNLTCISLYSNNGNQRILDIESSTVTITGQNAGQGIYGWDFSNYSMLTFLSMGSKIVFERNASLGIFNAMGQTFEDVEFLDVGNVFGSNSINNLTFHEDGRIGLTGQASDNTIKTLHLTAGKTLVVEANKTQTFDTDIIAVGNCNELITIKSSISGSQTNFVNNSGLTIDIDWTLLQDVSASGAAMDANNSVKLNSPGWGGTLASSHNYFWVGSAVHSDDKWSDPNNWSLTSGAHDPTGCIPGPEDNVEFNDLSFSLTHKTVTVDVETAFCKDMVWKQTNVIKPIFEDDAGAKELMIFGSLDLSGTTPLSDMEYKYKKPIYFQTNGINTSADINVKSGIQFQAQLWFVGPAKTWDMQSDLYNVSSLTIQYGTLKTNTYELNIGHFGGYADGTLHLNSTKDMIVRGSSTFNGSTTSWNTRSGFTLNANSGTIQLTSLQLPTLKAQGQNFHHVQFVDPDALGRVWNSSTFHELEFLGNGEFNDDNSTEILTFTPGKTYRFAAGKTTTILAGGTINSTGTPSDPIVIESTIPGSESFINKIDGSVCLDYVFMRDNHNISVPSVFFWAGLHSANTSNNVGWAFTDCVAPPPERVCNGYPYQFNKGLGIGSWVWDFDDPGCSGAGCNTSTLPNPTHVFSGLGTYYVTVDIFNLNQTTSTRATYIVNVESCCFAEADPSATKISSNLTLNYSDIWNGRYYIASNVTITVTSNATLDLTNVDMVFDDCAGMMIQDGASIRANNSVFRTCNQSAVWKGISFNNSKGSIFNECTFKNAVFALNLDQASEAMISNNLFHNNYNAVTIYNNPLGYESPISGNRFVVDNAPPDYAACAGFPASGNFGIVLFNSAMLESISQNDFVNTASEESKIHFSGIVCASSGARISENRFTDMYRSIDLSSLIRFTTVENNEIEVLDEKYEHNVQINLMNSSVNVVITGNELNNSNDYTVSTIEKAAIYVENTSNAELRANRISGFRAGIQALNASECAITENRISNGNNYGIYIEEGSSLEVGCNVIDLDFAHGSSGLQTIGLYFNNLDESSTIHSNCIFDCLVSVYGETPGATLPLFTNNYLYNYVQFGVYLDGYSGSIGTAPDPGMNTFYANYVNAFDVSSTVPITAADNFGMLVINNVTPTSSNPYYSTASCGHQIYEEKHQENLDPELQCEGFYLDNVLPLIRERDGGMTLMRDYARLYELKDVAGRLSAMLAGLRSVSDRDGIDGVQRFHKSIKALKDVSEREQHWLAYYVNRELREYAAAVAKLESLVPLNAAEANRRAIELLQSRLLMEGRSEVNLTANEKSILMKIAAGDGEWAPAALAILKVAQGGFDYAFKALRMPLLKPVRSETTMELSTSYARVFPNPADAEIRVRYSLARDNARELRISNVLGETLHSRSLANSAESLALDVSYLAPGSYFVTIRTENGKVIRVPFVKNR